jgi:hypothetical protein
MGKTATIPRNGNPGSWQPRGVRVGNSVPPFLMKAIAERIRQHLFMNESSAQ